MSDSADMAFTVTANLEAPRTAQERQYTVVYMSGGVQKNATFDSTTSATQKFAKLTELGIKPETDLWAAGYLNNQGDLELSGHPDLRDALRDKFPGRRLAS